MGKKKSKSKEAPEEKQARLAREEEQRRRRAEKQRIREEDRRRAEAERRRKEAEKEAERQRRVSERRERLTAYLSESSDAKPATSSKQPTSALIGDLCEVLRDNGRTDVAVLLERLHKHGLLSEAKAGRVPFAYAKSIADGTDSSLHALDEEYGVSGEPEDVQSVDYVRYCLDRVVAGKKTSMKETTRETLREALCMCDRRAWKRYADAMGLCDLPSGHITVENAADAWRDSARTVADAYGYVCTNLTRSAEYIGLSSATTKRLLDKHGIAPIDGYQQGWYQNWIDLYARKDLDALMATEDYEKARARSKKLAEKKESRLTERKRHAEEIRTGVSVRLKMRDVPLERAVVYVGPTNSGKTYRAMQQMRRLIDEFVARPDAKGDKERFVSALSGHRFVYAGPLRMLAMENYSKLCSEYGDECVGYLTGERRINPEAPIICCTPEAAPRSGDAIVLDECHWLSDTDRGHHWTNLLLGGDYKTFFAVCSADGRDAVEHLLSDAATIETVECRRLSPISYEGKKRDVASVPKRSAVICFSEKAVLAVCGYINSGGYVKAEALYGAMPLPVREEQLRRYADGEVDVIVCTDVIGHGINLPIDNVYFAETAKFDGTRRRQLLLWEAAQIAGRAGRYGIGGGRGTVGRVATGWKIDYDSSVVSSGTQAAAGSNKTDNVVRRAYVTPSFADLAPQTADDVSVALSAWTKKAAEADAPFRIAASPMPQRRALIEAAEAALGRSSHGVKWGRIEAEELWNLSGLPMDPKGEAFAHLVRFLAGGREAGGAQSQNVRFVLAASRREAAYVHEMCDGYDAEIASFEAKRIAAEEEERRAREKADAVRLAKESVCEARRDVSGGEDGGEANGETGGNGVQADDNAKKKKKKKSKKKNRRLEDAITPLGRAAVGDLMQLENMASYIEQVSSFVGLFGEDGLVSQEELDEAYSQVSDAVARLIPYVEADNGIGICCDCGARTSPWFYQCDRCHKASRSWYGGYGYDYDDYDFEDIW